MPEVGVVRGEPRGEASRRNWTVDIPEVVWLGMIGSEAEAESKTEPDMVEPVVGEVMETRGLVVSGRIPSMTS